MGGERRRERQIDGQTDRQKERRGRERERERERERTDRRTDRQTDRRTDMYRQTNRYTGSEVIHKNGERGRTAGSPRTQTGRSGAGPVAVAWPPVTLLLSWAAGGGGGERGWRGCYDNPPLSPSQTCLSQMVVNERGQETVVVYWFLHVLVCSRDWPADTTETHVVDQTISPSPVMLTWDQRDRTLTL